MKRIAKAIRLANSPLPSKKQWKRWTLPSKWGVVGSAASIIGLPIGVIGILLGILFYLWSRDSEKEVVAAGRHLAQQELSVKQHSEDLENEANQQERDAETTARLQDIQALLEDKYKQNEMFLSEMFPYGYVVLASDGKVSSKLKVFSGGVEMSADWNDTQIEIDRASKRFRVSIPKIEWTQGTGTLKGRRYSVSGEYELGVPVLIQRYLFKRGPGMCVVVIEDNPEKVYLSAIGFREIGKEDFVSTPKQSSENPKLEVPNK